MNSRIFNIECITSKTNSTIVKIAKLSKTKYRKEEQLFTLDGVKLFLEAYNFGAKIKYIIINNDALLDEEIIDKIKLIKQNNTQVICVNDQIFSKLTDENSPQGIITVCSFLESHNYSDVAETDTSEKVLMLESIRDPGNLGSIVRNAAAFGINRLILSSDCVDIYSQKVIRASMGAIFKVKIDIVNNVIATVEKLQENGRRVIATTLRENSIVLGKDAINKKDVFIIGNEGHGVTDITINASDETMFIPMCVNTESLNASVAAAIIMWEMFKL